jgi:hypothetical protein
VSRRVVVSEKANTHALPLFRGPLFTVKPPISGQVAQVRMSWLLMLMLSCCSHTFTFHYKLQGATNIPCDEVLTVPAHLPMQKSVPTVLPTALDRFLHLLIHDNGGVRFRRFRAHERNNHADERGNSEHIGSVLHDKKGRVNSRKKSTGTHLGGASGLICIHDGSRPSFSGPRFLSLENT